MASVSKIPNNCWVSVIILNNLFLKTKDKSLKTKVLEMLTRFSTHDSRLSEDKFRSECRELLPGNMQG